MLIELVRSHHPGRGGGMVVSLVGVAPALTDTTVGQTGDPDPSTVYVSTGYEDVQTSATMPSAGVVTSFHTESGTRPIEKPSTTTFDFQVLRPLDGDQYRVVGDTGDEVDPCDSALYPFPVRIPVQAGDVLGVYIAYGLVE